MKIEVPTNINDIKLGQYQRFSLINTDDQDEEFLLHKTIEIFCDVDISIVSKFPLKDAKDINDDIVAVMDSEAQFTRFFSIDGVEYGFIPDLSDMTLGEYIDLEDGLKEFKSFHKAAAVMYRPVTRKIKDLYNIEPYDASMDAVDKMKNAPLGAISAAIVFFYHIVKELLAVSLVYSRKEADRTRTMVESLNLPRNTDGLIPSMRSPTAGQ